MFLCPQCGWTGTFETACPHCQGEFEHAQERSPRSFEGAASSTGTDDWETIARFGNAAEAGYFANELQFVLGCEPHLERLDDFDALGHQLRTSYALSVPPVLADHARSQFQRMLEGEAVEPAAERSSNDWSVEARDAEPAGSHLSAATSNARPSASSVNWVPIVLTLAAGSMVLWGGKKLHVQRRPEADRRDAQRIDVWDALAREEVPWSQPSPNGAGVRELLVNPADGTAILREDTDGDGTFESETLYRIDRN